MAAEARCSRLHTRLSLQHSGPCAASAGQGLELSSIDSNIIHSIYLFVESAFKRFEFEDLFKTGVSTSCLQLK